MPLFSRGGQTWVAAPQKARQPSSWEEGSQGVDWRESFSGLNKAGAPHTHSPPHPLCVCCEARSQSSLSDTPPECPPHSLCCRHTLHTHTLHVSTQPESHPARPPPPHPLGARRTAQVGNTPAPPPTSQPGFHPPLLLPLVGVPSSVYPQTLRPHTG